MKRALRLAFAIGLALAPQAWAGDTFEAVLVGSYEVPGPGISEGFDAVVVLEGTKVTLTLTPKGIRGWMSAHIHKGAADLDEAAEDDEAAGLDPNATERRQREARAEGLTESEGLILKEVAFDCNRALAPLEARIRAARERGAWSEETPLWGH